MLADTPIVVTVSGTAALGDEVTVRLVALDPVARTSECELTSR
jgi:hypothetical protein